MYRRITNPRSSWLRDSKAAATQAESKEASITCPFHTAWPRSGRSAPHLRCLLLHQRDSRPSAQESDFLRRFGHWSKRRAVSRAWQVAVPTAPVLVWAEYSLFSNRSQSSPTVGSSESG